ADLLVWLALCMLVILGLSDNPLFSTVAMLMWLIAAQVIVAVIVNSPALVALIGILSLLLALAGSYLTLVEQVSADERAPVVTDITFPADLRIPAASTFEPEEEDGWVQWLRRQTWGAAALERTRQLMARWRP